MDVWRDPTRYGTRDGTIPFGLFWIYYGAMRSVHALERVQQTRAVSHAIGMVFAKKDDGLPESLTADLVDAYLSPPRER